MEKNYFFDARLSAALPELSKNARDELDQFLSNDVGIKRCRDLLQVTHDDIMRSGLLTSNQAAALMKHWQCRIVPPTVPVANNARS